ncbi:MAG TPA: HNH endonuclease domain-containing protein [Allocoleopsis sp.]
MIWLISEGTAIVDIASNQVISTILRHDSKVTSYKIALLRSINDVVLSFPDLRTYHQDVAVPLRLLAEYWVAYYWGFVDSTQPIAQGQRAQRDGELRNDMAFRPALTKFRQQWETQTGGLSQAADGFLVIHELRIPRKRSTYPDALLAAYQKTLMAIAKTIKMPIQYAGPGNWTVFEKPMTYQYLGDRVVAVPGTQAHEVCLVISAELWQTFQAMSLWVEALCIHEWCLFTERVSQSQQPVSRGAIYTLLTDRPDNRRPLSWESNQIDILLLEGEEFRCPWTAKRIVDGVAYDLDHLLPLSVYPINELWNLIPANPGFNRHVKRDRLPSTEKLFAARSALEWDYGRYGVSAMLSQALQEDVRLRFTTLSRTAIDRFPVP